jgi:hypothetical protein
LFVPFALGSTSQNIPGAEWSRDEDVARGTTDLFIDETKFPPELAGVPNRCCDSAVHRHRRLDGQSRSATK